MESAVASAQLLGLLTAIGLLVTALTVIVSINHFLFPLDQLIEAARRITQGDMAHRVQIKSGDEIEKLGNAFNTMMQSVVDSRRDIDLKVDQQTKDILEKNKLLKEHQKKTLTALEEAKAARKTAAEKALELKKYLLAVEGASDHIIITDSEGTILYANNAVHKVTGFTPREVVGKKAGAKELWGGLMDKDFYTKMWHTVKVERKPFSALITNQRKNGEKYQAQTNISPISENGEVRFFVAIERDVTKEKEVDRMKTEFISLASHQLRTPLSAMKWFLEMLLGGDAGVLTKEQTEMIVNIRDSNERMIALVNSLLNLSRIESGRIIIEPTPTNIEELVRETLLDIGPRLKTKRQRLTVKVDDNIPYINLDPKLIRNVLINLLTNAVKYTPAGGKIEVFVLNKGESIVFQVSDNGYGVLEKEKDKIFEKLYRGSNVVKLETEGTGLGLYIAKSIVESSGGEIGFESRENKGSTFWFSLPISGMKAKAGEVTVNG
jgi:PAS domain S-box-containing protein